jgi:RNA polymerase sigma factor (sigma-70 family)
MSEDLDQWFETKIRVHERGLRRFIREWVHNDDVFDVLNEVYARVWKDATRCTQRAYAEPKAFAYQVARNLLIDYARRNRIVRINLLEDPDSLNLLVDYVTPERSASDQEDVERVEDCLDQLSARRREVVLLHRVQGLSQKEIAARLAITEGTVEQTFVTAMRQLTRCVSSDEQEADARTPARIGMQHGE